MKNNHVIGRLFGLTVIIGFIVSGCASTSTKVPAGERPPDKNISPQDRALLEHLNTELQGDNPTPLNYFFRGSTYYNINDREKAIADLKKYLELESNALMGEEAKLMLIQMGEQSYAVNSGPQDLEKTTWYYEDSSKNRTEVLIVWNETGVSFGTKSPQQKMMEGVRLSVGIRGLYKRTGNNTFQITVPEMDNRKFNIVVNGDYMLFNGSLFERFFDVPEAGDFEIKVANRMITITGYKGTAKDVVIPPQMGGFPVTVIGSRAFYKKGITSVIIPNGITHIYARAFGDNQLASVTIPESVILIASFAFSENQLTNVVLPPAAQIMYDSFDSKVTVTQR
jgi:hypothetical protein